jgi:hypothetical protein
MAKVVCGKCQVGPRLVARPNGEVEAVCPECGQWDTVEEASRIAADHAADTGLGSFQRGFARSARGNRFAKFETRSQEKPIFRWHAV